MTSNHEISSVAVDSTAALAQLSGQGDNIDGITVTTISNFTIIHQLSVLVRIGRGFSVVYCLDRGSCLPQFRKGCPNATPALVYRPKLLAACCCGLFCTHHSAKVVRLCARLTCSCCTTEQITAQQECIISDWFNRHMLHQAPLSTPDASHPCVAKLLTHPSAAYILCT